MEVFIIIVLFILGLLLIIKGGDYLVDSSIWIAKVTGIPEIIIGVTIVSVATTLPEVMVSVIAVIKGVVSNDTVLLSELSGLAIGNAVGSMLSNICLSLAIVLMAKKLITECKSFRIKGIFLITITILAYLCVVFDGVIDVWEGVLLLMAFVGFMALNVLEAKKEMQEAKCAIDSPLNDIKENHKAKVKKSKAEKDNAVKMIVMFFIGTLGIGIGAWLLVEYGQAIAILLSVPAQVVGVTIVAIGTGLPELVTSLSSLKKDKASLGIGNIIGANVINATLLLGLIAVISGKGLPIDAISKNVGFLVLILVTLILLLPALIKKRTFKWQGYVLMGIYIAFLSYNIITIL